MKPALLALAVILACAVYELDRESTLAADWHTPVQIDRLLSEESRTGDAESPAGHDGGNGYMRPDRETVLGHTARTGSVVREHSIRLFGPGVSRRQQLRV
jgi:hypothetical protein